MDSYLENREKFPSAKKGISVENEKQENLGDSIPAISANEAVVHNQEGEPKVELVMENDRVSKICITYGENQYLELQCAYQN